MGGFGPFFSFLTHSRFFQSHKHKIICYCPDDLIYPAVPGLYPSITSWWVRHGWGRGAPYLSSHIHQHRFDPLSSTARDILFSFVGSTKTDPLRQKLSQLDHPRARFVDSTPASSKQYWFEKSEDSIRASFEQYRDLMSRTKFALCPRGVSASSIRLRSHGKWLRADHHCRRSGVTGRTRLEKLLDSDCRKRNLGDPGVNGSAGAEVRRDELACTRRLGGIFLAVVGLPSDGGTGGNDPGRVIIRKKIVVGSCCSCWKILDPTQYPHSSPARFETFSLEFLSTRRCSKRH